MAKQTTAPAKEAKEAKTKKQTTAPAEETVGRFQVIHENGFAYQGMLFAKGEFLSDQALNSRIRLGLRFKQIQDTTT